MNTEKHFEKAIQYVKENHKWSDAKDALALETINAYRCDINFADHAITEEIHDLMEEYGQDNDLPEGWWYEQGDEDDIFFSI